MQHIQAKTWRRRVLGGLASVGGLAVVQRLSAAEPDRTFTPDEVATCDGADGRPMWVTYKGSVHDVTFPSWPMPTPSPAVLCPTPIPFTAALWSHPSLVLPKVTSFSKEHPGGAYIEHAAGGDVEGFWSYWAYHHLSPKVAQALATTRIGKLASTDSSTEEAATALPDPYEDEPSRDRRKHHQLTEKPYCSETRSDVLCGSYLTPTDALYVRNHAPVPSMGDAVSFRMSFFDGEEEVAIQPERALHTLPRRYDHLGDSMRR